MSKVYIVVQEYAGEMEDIVGTFSNLPAAAREARYIKKEHGKSVMVVESRPDVANTTREIEEWEWPL